ncbi:hypothetical protein CQ14_03060 [Bradyrhizobium lablabi]|uniref:Uncharacterized protein n=1 Tax=Bradyrhizobium lablabi TaxID=722472 RepID=A0A0R3N2Y1_9BRAD|nr:hypothetical protein [Bradyrhizobium lablabi]KRR26481.1 hypothetical protein CQ14_03060 [Bradyrhizobium lablabi]
MPATTSKFKRQPNQRLYSRAGHRLREIERLIKHRHGTLPDTDDADVYLVPVARCFIKILRDKGPAATAPEISDRLALWCGRWAPNITAGQIAGVVDEALDNPRFDRDDDLGAALRLTYAERRRLKLKTIGSYDINRAGRQRLAKDRKRERDRLRAAEKRLANGALPRAVYEAQSLSRARPWEQLGISRATFMRRRKKASEAGIPLETSASPHPSSIHERRTCLTGTGGADETRAARALRPKRRPVGDALFRETGVKDSGEGEVRKKAKAASHPNPTTSCREVAA